jgi:4-oxalomesaconate hydratase
MADQKTALVVSAHSADFVWRAGGAVALHAEKGYRVVIVCLSFGERGESAKIWRKGNTDVDKVKAARRVEAQKAADILGGEVQFWDLGDYPLRSSDEVLFRLTDLIREIRPKFLMSHSMHDPYNFDHGLTTHLVQEARITAQAHGYNPGVPVIKAPPIFLYEPHQTEMCNWKPDLYLDIGSVWEKKRKAIEAMEGQEYLWEYYTRVALNRGVQATRNSDKMSVTYGEAYMRIFPQTVTELGDLG